MTESKPLFTSKWVLTALLAIIFALGLIVRLYDFKAAPLDFNPTRQLHSALMARGMYYQTTNTIPEAQRALGIELGKAEGVIELPVMEWLTATAYRLAGHEILWIARLYSIFFWMLGSIAMFLLSRELTSSERPNQWGGALVGFAYFLILPFGILASRAFQPDPLMTSVIIWALWALVRWQRTPTWKWTITAGVLGGLAILFKAVAVFFIGGAWIGLILADQGLLKALRNRQVWLFGVLTVLPYGSYHIYGVYINGFLASQMSLRFFPEMWKDPLFYLRWNGEIASTVGFEWFLLAIFGCLALRNKSHRGMFLGLLVGYFIYGMSLSHHISTHDYYQDPLIPVVALGLAVGGDAVLRALKGPRALIYVLTAGVLIYALTIKAWDARVAIKRNNHDSEIPIWQELGKKFNPSENIIGLTSDYGYRLAYYGGVRTAQWMTSADFNYRAMNGETFDMKALFQQQVEGKDYFVVTMFGELDKQPALKSMLNSQYAVLAQTGDYLIYDLHHPLKTP